jgi:hypothetical protein
MKERNNKIVRNCGPKSMKRLKKKNLDRLANTQLNKSNETIFAYPQNKTIKNKVSISKGDQPPDYQKNKNLTRCHTHQVSKRIVL